MDHQPESDPIVVLYIGGEGRSGSTLLAALIGNHEGYFPIGEFRDVWQALTTDEFCGCGEPFSKCGFWTRVGDVVFGGWDRVDAEAMLTTDANFARQRRIPRLLAASLRSSRNDPLSEYRQLLGRLYATIQRESGCSVIVDSTKDPAYALVLSKVPGISLRLVHLTRDSRGVAYSWMKKSVARPEYAGHPELRGTFMGTRNLWRGALEWDVKNFLFHCLPLASERRLIKYESVMSTPHHELERVFEIASTRSMTPSNAAQPRPQFEFLPFHTLGGNRVRFERGRINLREDDEWTRTMRRSQQLVVGVLTAPFLVAYGYLRPWARLKRAPISLSASLDGRSKQPWKG